jgi:hypothetical protein
MQEEEDQKQETTNFVTLIEDLKDNHIEVRIDSGAVIVKINKKTMFETLANKDFVIGSINRSLIDTIQKHLHSMASAQRQGRFGINLKGKK